MKCFTHLKIRILRDGVHSQYVWNGISHVKNLEKNKGKIESKNVKTDLSLCIESLGKFESNSKKDINESKIVFHVWNKL